MQRQQRTGRCPLRRDGSQVQHQARGICSRAASRGPPPAHLSSPTSLRYPDSGRGPRVELCRVTRDIVRLTSPAPAPTSYTSCSTYVVPIAPCSLHLAPCLFVVLVLRSDMRRPWRRRRGPDLLSTVYGRTAAVERPSAYATRPSTSCIEHAHVACQYVRPVRRGWPLARSADSTAMHATCSESRLRGSKKAPPQAPHLARH